MALQGTLQHSDGFNSIFSTSLLDVISCCNCKEKNKLNSNHENYTDSCIFFLSCKYNASFYHFNLHEAELLIWKFEQHSSTCYTLCKQAYMLSGVSVSNPPYTSCWHGRFRCVDCFSIPWAASMGWNSILYTVQRICLNQATTEEHLDFINDPCWHPLFRYQGPNEVCIPQSIGKQKTLKYLKSNDVKIKCVNQSVCITYGSLLNL